MHDESRTQDAAKRRQSRGVGLRRAGLVPAAAFVLVMSVTFFAFIYVAQLERRATRVAFESAASNMAAAVRREFERSKAIVDSVGSLFDASETVTDDEFGCFAKPLLDRQPSVAGLGWVPRVRHADRKNHELEAQASHPGYRVTERKQQGDMVRRKDAPEYFPVRFVAPVRTNEAALGFDIASDQVRMAALIAARSTGEIISSAPIQLVQEERSSRSFLLFRPCYRQREPGLDRDRDLVGLASAVFRADHLVEESLDALSPIGIDFDLLDVTAAPSKPELLATHRARTRAQSDGEISRGGPALFFQSDLDVVGRRLRLEFTSAPGRFATTISVGARGLLITGLLSAIAITAFLLILQRSDSRAKEYARRLQGLSQRLIKTQEIERHHLARELHDHLGQDLTALRMNMHVAKNVQSEDDAAEILAENNEIIDRILDQVRTISLDLRPAVLDDLGLEPALHSYLKRETKRSGLKLIYECDPALDRLPEAVETASFRFSQEALTNVIRHAGATTVNVSLSRVDGDLRLWIKDDGDGFELEPGGDEVHQFASCGLLGMQERVSVVGGQMSLRSEPGEGTVVEALIPID